MIRQIEPWIDKNELVELERVIRSTFVVEAELTAEFEAMTRELTGSRHAIAICNGTMALYVCLNALGIGEGDEVIVPDMTFVATANAVIMAGARPVLCEIDPETFCMDVSRAHGLVTERTKAIMPVHLYGQSADMVALRTFSDKYGLKIVEDAAQGVGVRFNGKHVGTIGDMGILSYYGNKTITCGEGGIILTDSDELAKTAYRLKNHGRDAKGTFVHEHIGFNFSFTEMQAAIGISQMKKLGAITHKKQQIRQRYIEELSDIEGFKAVHIDSRCSPVFWFTSFLSEDTDRLAESLQKDGIQTRRFFYPLHLQPCYADKKYVKNLNDTFEVSERIYRKGLSLPSSYLLTDAEQTRVIEKIRIYHSK